MDVMFSWLGIVSSNVIVDWNVGEAMFENLLSIEVDFNKFRCFDPKSLSGKCFCPSSGKFVKHCKHSDLLPSGSVTLASCPDSCVDWTFCDFQGFCCVWDWLAGLPGILAKGASASAFSFGNTLKVFNSSASSGSFGDVCCAKSLLVKLPVGCCEFWLAVEVLLVVVLQSNVMRSPPIRSKSQQASTRRQGRGA